MIALVVVVALLTAPPAAAAGRFPHAGDYDLKLGARTFIVHVPRDAAARAPLPVLIAFHGGSGQVHAEDWFDEKLSISATLFEPDEMRRYMEATGLAVDDVTARDPYDFEYPTRRVYAAATKR